MRSVVVGASVYTTAFTISKSNAHPGVGDGMQSLKDKTCEAAALLPA